MHITVWQIVVSVLTLATFWFGCGFVIFCWLKKNNKKLPSIEELGHFDEEAPMERPKEDQGQGRHEDTVIFIVENQEPQKTEDEEPQKDPAPTTEDEGSRR